MGGPWTLPKPPPALRYEPEIHEMAAANVAKGLAWLQESGPLYGLDWRRVGVLNPIRSASYEACPLAQAARMTYGSAIDMLVRRKVLPMVGWSPWVHEHGFYDGGEGSPNWIPYPALDQAWIEALTQARALEAS